MMTEDIPEICYETLTWHDNSKVQRVVVCAANRYETLDGTVLVVPCVRHYSKEHREVIKRLDLKLLSVHGEDQGFLDQFSNYWNRHEALVIATHAGQVGYRREKTWPEDELFSEDLY